MKKNIIKYLTLVLLIASNTMLFISCTDDNNGAAPIVDRVSLVAKDSTTELGYRGSTYAIFGSNLATTQYVYFNGEKAPLNATLVRNDNIIVRIGDNTPYIQGMNKLRVVTKFGEA